VQSNLCLGCGLVFLSPRLTSAEYGLFYRGIYRPLVSAYHGRLIDAVTVEDEQRTYTDNLLRFLLPQLQGHSIRTLLDVGGSTGVIAAGLKEAIGCEGIVLDPSPDELKRAERRGLRTICSLVEDYDPASSGRFDLVLLCQTIDHLLDVKGSLSRIRDMMNDDGFFYVDFVDFQTIAKREGRVEGGIKIDHPYYFTRETMEPYLKQVGFSIQAMMIMPDGHHVGYLCRKSKPAAQAHDITATAAMQLSWIRQLQALPGKSA
jgi:SAM-dependent methyltransferase